MGERGPGARPRKQRPATQAATRTAPLSWQKPLRTRAARVIEFIESLTITSGKGAGEKFKLRPWQKEIVRDLYRTKRGKLVTRTAVISVARKNGKSTLIAGIALAHLVGPEVERRGQIVVGASDRDQSGIIFDEIEAMLEANEELRDQVSIKSHDKTILHYESGSKFRALSSDAKKSHGLNPSVVILDELAQWGSGVGARLYNALMTASGGRLEPLKIIISTQAEDDQSKMSELVDYGRQVNEGVIDAPGFMCRVWETPEEYDPFDEEGWALANPALGDFRTLADMRELAEWAKRMPSQRAAFENLYLNRRVDAEERWIGKLDWQACQGEVVTRGPCFGGLDLGSTSDLTSFALFWPETGALLTWSWCPRERIAERSERDRVPYDDWSRRGLIELTEGKATDKRAVALRLAELNVLYRPTLIGFDAWGMPELQRILDEEGIELPLEKVRQGFVTMSPAMKAFEEAVMNGTLVHDGNATLTWAMSNVRVARDAAGNLKPDKSRSREKIDPAVAGVMAVGIATSYLEEGEERVFHPSDTAVLISDEVQPLGVL